MPYLYSPLKELGEISQGLSLSRYKDERGSPERIVNASDLELLQLEGSLSQTQLSLSNTEQYQRYRLHINDVVIAIRGLLLKASVITAKSQGSIAGQNVAFFRPKLDLINPVYLALLLRSKWLERSRNSFYEQSSTIPLIRISQLRDFKIPVPEKSLQDKLAYLFLTVERETKITIKALEIRQKLAELILVQLLEGE